MTRNRPNTNYGPTKTPLMQVRGSILDPVRGLWLYGSTSSTFGMVGTLRAGPFGPKVYSKTAATCYRTSTCYIGLVGTIFGLEF